MTQSGNSNTTPPSATGNTDAASVSPFKPTDTSAVKTRAGHSDISGLDPSRAYRPWTIRRQNGTRGMVPNNAELRAWIEQGRIAGDDELSPDGQQWTQFSAIKDLDAFVAAAPPARTRRNSQMSMPAVRMSEDSVRPPGMSGLGSIPPAPKVPFLGRTSVVPPPEGHKPSVPPPAHTHAATPNTGSFAAPAAPRPASLSPLAPSRSTGSFPAVAQPQPTPKPSATIPPLFGPTTVNTSDAARAAATPDVTATPRVTQRGLPVAQLDVAKTPSVAPPAAAEISVPIAATTTTHATGVDLLTPSDALATSIVASFATTSATGSSLPKAPTTAPPPNASMVTRSGVVTTTAGTSTPPPALALGETGTRKLATPLFGATENTADKPATAPVVPSATASSPTTPLTASKRAGHSIPPIASIVVDDIASVPTERASNRTTDRLPVAPSALSSAARVKITGALSVLALCSSTVAIVQTARNKTTVPSVVVGAATAGATDGTRASLDQQIEQLSALIANRITPAGAESPQQGSTAIAAMQTQRARFLAMRAELFRGLAEDLEFEAQNKSGDESLLLRAEARVLRRQGSVDIQRSVNDARSSAATVPSAANIAQWAWSHALVHAVHADRDAAVTYLDRARASGANVGYLEGVLARQQSQWEAAQLAFDHAAEGSEQREFSLIAAARTARSRGQTEQARSLAQRVLQTNALHDGALSVLQSISGPAQPTARAAVTPSGGLPASDTTLQPPTASTVAAQPSSYAALIAEGQRWMRRGEYQKARASYRQALAVQPDGVEARSGEAWLNLRMGSYQAAHTAFRELYAANRREHEYRAGLALSLEKLQRNDEAIREMRSYLGLAPWGMHSDEVRRRLAVLAPANPRR